MYLDDLTGVEPFTGDNIAEIVIFSAGRSKNVVIAATLVFPNHQAAASILYRKS
ncbi:hypothetical protein PENANT_c002G10830 [Penicillium antarcticum]|uniref:Uncharacterized protein n=1 Tax=Penicillium antarcticum TaxID=416450 RepID=A0A1V6QKD6_9EURO|nr:hypothetical protein PENANT_c002G10830 [Penicillium antarcticum]